MTSTSKKALLSPPSPDPEQLLNQLWQQFDALFPDDEASLEKIVQQCLEHGVVICRRCDVQNVERVEGEPRDVRCRDCGSVFSATARTFFDHMRKHRAWLAAIWLFERGATPTSLTFHNLLNIAQSSAKVILNRVMTVIHEQMPSDAIEFPSAAFSTIFCRRSRETVARQHPVSEEQALSGCADHSEPEGSDSDTIQPLHADQMPASDYQQGETPVDAQEESQLLLSADEDQILCILNQKPKNLSELINVSGLASRQATHALTMLEVNGFCKRLPGNNYVALKNLPAFSAPPQTIPADSAKTVARLSLIYSVDESELLAAVVNFIRCNYQGVSRKYLQLYLAAFWCFTEGRRSENRALLAACTVHKPITTRTITETVTDRVVRVAARATAA